MDINEQNKYINTVSVPIRGLFNLTSYKFDELMVEHLQIGFRPHQGII